LPSPSAAPEGLIAADQQHAAPAFLFGEAKRAGERADRADPGLGIAEERQRHFRCLRRIAHCQRHAIRLRAGHRDGAIEQPLAAEQLLRLAAADPPPFAAGGNHNRWLHPVSRLCRPDAGARHRRAHRSRKPARVCGCYNHRQGAKP
jgi:hypothetical protein